MIPYSGDRTEIVNYTYGGIANTPEKVQFRESVLQLQGAMVDAVEEYGVDPIDDTELLTHHFTPMSEEFGCSVYGREMFIPKGSVIVGKIHRHAHINVISQGKIAVSTEHGKKILEAPITFVSEPGTKRAVHALEDTVWTTVHLVDNPGAENVDDIVDTLTSETYAEMGMIDNSKLLGDSS